ncbi:MAG TPA: DUF721 domain-containing protein [bacterium]|nr:DUF721 domain-containing protein [bacterium]
METVRNVIENVFKELENPVNLKHRKLMEKWPSIAGPKIAPHTKPVLGKKGELYVWADQSALAFELKQRYSQSLLKRTQAALGESIQSIRFFVGQLR